MGKEATFELGYDIEAYLQIALEKLVERYPWAKRSLFDEQYRYAIEQENGEYHYVRYLIFSKEDTVREVWDVNPPSPYHRIHSSEEFVNQIVSDQNYHMAHANPVVKKYIVSFAQPKPIGKDGHWLLEHYEFHRLETGDFKSFVEAGYQREGASRDFYIPRSYFYGTYEEFLSQYCAMVPGERYGLYQEDLEKDLGLRAFLGFQ